MSTWSEVGSWLKDNGGSLVGLAGAVVTGNIPAGVAAVASMVSEATGETDPGLALARLRADPATLIKMEEIAKRDEADLRLHHREVLKIELEDQQKAHEQQQETIRSGDNAVDKYVRRTRPRMARQSWYATVAYVLVFEGVKAWSSLVTTGANMELAMILISPAAAYIGFRTADKIWQKKKPPSAGVK